jgi:hypothetical protein
MRPTLEKGVVIRVTDSSHALEYDHRSSIEFVVALKISNFRNQAAAAELWSASLIALWNSARTRS